jgi:hypothetical protein
MRAIGYSSLFELPTPRRRIDSLVDSRYPVLAKS